MVFDALTGLSPVMLFKVIVLAGNLMCDCVYDFLTG